MIGVYSYLLCIDLNQMCATQGDSSSVTLAVAGQAACKGMQIQVPFDLPLTGYGKDGMISPEKLFYLATMIVNPLSYRQTLDMECQVFKN